MGGWHKVLYPPLLALAAGQKVAPPAGKSLMLEPGSALAAAHPEGVSPGTPNFRWMAAAWWYAWSIRFGNLDDRIQARERIAELYGQEKTVGHQLLEQTCPEPHDQFHRMSHAVIRLAAWEKTDSAVLAASAWWWSARTALDAAGATPDGEVILPGTRGDGGPTTQIGSAIYRMIAGLPHQGPARTAHWWTDPAWGGGAPAVVKHLLETGDHLGVRFAPIPKLRLPMTVHRTPKGHQITLQGHPELEPIIDWVSVVYDRTGHHLVTFGKDWKTAPPVGA